MNKALAAATLGLIALGGAFYSVERRKLTAQEIPVIAVLAALAALGRIPFAMLPGVQPTTFFVIMAGFVFGPAAGFLTGATGAFVSNCFLGHGPWTI
ncbi:MAG: ECF transporter S component, partial [Candidatus Aureabacteria bacterium]|nr:ECF transporter S component [Candidatus Auribacterota bacterium]